ncbi:hypothetical protein LFYK43_01780 [Ligilactobacillus salitolerans]|uniref:Uncharacterized protein n=1 Tax=Ligilactobacillus salitolerans TaxID=1808352 RepID=A0A401IQA2_9LACO|nr:hypothetical protein [Ligilactobacillus salitolerans]GBG93719.1 hypothetical protein LFYK43_01780 [Ligilactobacillus salitolerans]
MKEVSASSSHSILMLVIAVIFILDGFWQVLKGATSLTRRYQQKTRQNEPTASVSWLQLILGVTMVAAGCILVYSAIMNF